MSVRYSNIVLRLGLAAVFLWFGVDNFFHPSYWTGIYTSVHPASILRILRLPVSQLIYLTGILELLVGLSLVTGVFTKFFSILSIVFLLSTVFLIGIDETTIRNFALIGGFASLALWPNERGRF